MKKTFSSIKRVKTGTILCLLLIISTGLFIAKDEVSLSGNESSRFATIQALSEQGTFAVDNTVFPSIDKGKRNGKYYSDKPYLTSVLGTAAALPLRMTGMTFKADRNQMIFLINWILFCTENILLFLLFRALLLRKSPDLPEKTGNLLPLLFVFGTLIFSYSVSINNHTPAALMVLLILYLFHRNRTGKISFFTGIAAGLLFDFDFLFGGCFGIGCFLLILFPEGRKIDLRGAFLYAAGAVPSAFLTFLLNWIAYGSLLPLYYLSTHTVAAVSARVNHIGEYLFHSLFGFKGFFSYMPVLLFGVSALFRKPERVKTVLLLSVFAAMGYYCYATQDYGGWCYGMRYFIPGIPVLFFYGLETVADLHGKIWKGLFAASAVIGLVVSSLGAFEPWCVSWEPLRSKDSWKTFRNSVEGNFLCASFRYAPDSTITRYLIEKKYGPDQSVKFLFVSACGMKQFGTAEELLKRYPDPALSSLFQKIVAEKNRKMQK